jgi:hypothetical protein
MRHLCALTSTFLVCGLLPTLAVAQLAPSNPYADGMKDAGKITGWKPFYKPPKISLDHQIKYAMGWCRWKGYEYKPSDLVDVDKLPEGTFSGKVAGYKDGLLIGVKTASAPETPAAEEEMFAIHADPAITKIAVQGTAVPEGLKTGQHVKFVGKVNSSGRVVDLVSRLEIFTPTADWQVREVVPDIETSIGARIGRYQAGQLVLTLKSGKQRTLNARLSEKPEITVHVSDFGFVAVGDQVTVKGRLYRPDTQPNVTEVFASDVEVRLSQPVGQAKATRIAKLAGN